MEVIESVTEGTEVRVTTYPMETKVRRELIFVAMSGMQLLLS